MDKSIVEYVGSNDTATKCGYCKKLNTSYTQGVWGYKMACQDFQVLVDRGFQRSGNYVYRPVMKKTCCPQYVIRMDVRDFKLSKSQKSVIKKFKRYLTDGLQNSTTEETSVDPPLSKSASSEKKVKKEVRPGAGPDPSKPVCKKAKVLRQERKKKKQQAAKELQAAKESAPELLDIPGDKEQEKLSVEPEGSKFRQELKEILAFTNEESNAHTFKTRLVPVQRGNPEFDSTYEESYSVFKQFQLGVHKEAEADCQQRHFKDFLIDSPLGPVSHSGTIKYGTFHYQYIIDDKIFAVGVLDIIPKGIVCEYLYYNPTFRFIAPGVLSALLEISLTQQYFLQDEAIQYYYMGYYVQSCPKMNYKSRYSASALLCTETYTYVDLEKCVPVLKASPYARLADAEVQDADNTCTEEELGEVMLLTRGAGLLKYGQFKQLTGANADEAVRGYVALVGKELTRRMNAHIGATEAHMYPNEDDMPSDEDNIPPEEDNALH